MHRLQHNCSNHQLAHPKRVRHNTCMQHSQVVDMQRDAACDAYISDQHAGSKSLSQPFCPKSSGFDRKPAVFETPTFIFASTWIRGHTAQQDGAAGHTMWWCLGPSCNLRQLFTSTNITLLDILIPQSPQHMPPTLETIDTFYCIQPPQIPIIIHCF